MSGRTLAMMLFILALNWGGFVAALLYGMRRDARDRGLENDE
ncbi:MAG TPA: hypothetical protein VM364_02870 [Vicinamibacterales bacterium]|nr:hypothetical protein [Vicinamibacterales bacterium]